MTGLFSAAFGVFMAASVGTTLLVMLDMGMAFCGVDPRSDYRLRVQEIYRYLGALAMLSLLASMVLWSLR